MKERLKNMQMIYQVNPEILKAENIVIYGAGSSGEKLLSQLLADNVYVNFFCDSNKSLWGTKIMNKTVISPEELIKIKDNCAILISSVYWEEIFYYLKELGIEKIYLTHDRVFGHPKS